LLLADQVTFVTIGRIDDELHPYGFSFASRLSFLFSFAVGFCPPSRLD